MQQTTSNYTKRVLNATLKCQKKNNPSTPAKRCTNKTAFQLKQSSIFEIKSDQYIENTQS